MSTPNEALIPVTILGSRWLRGGNGPKEESRLLHPVSGQMCCLGFCALAVGHTEEEIRDKAYSNSLTPRENAPESFYSDISSIGDTAYINDTVTIESDKERIRLLTPRLRNLGFSPTFDLDH